MKKINILIFALFALISAAFVLAVDPFYILDLEPIDDFDWTVNGTSLVFEVNCSPLSYANTSSIALWTNSTSTWKVNKTNATQSYTAGGEVYYEFNTSDLSMDGIDAPTYTTMIWSFGCYDNNSNVSFSENRTLNYQKSLNLFNVAPASGTYGNTQANTISYNISEQISSSIAYCELWTNRSGNGTQWAFAMSHESNNASGTSFDYTFKDGTSTLWQLICYDGHEKRFRKDSTNYTLHVDSSTLTAAIVKPSDTYSTNGTDLGINVTCTGNYIAGAGLFLDGVLDNTYPDTVVSGEQFIIANLTPGDGTFNLTVECINSYGTRYNSSKFILIVDTNAPNFGTRANWTIYDCNSLGLNLSANEDINTSSIYYGINGQALSNTDTDSLGRAYRLHTLDYGYYTEIEYSVNFSIDDNAGNRNTTLFTVTSPVGLCSGWNVYTVYDAAITMIDLEAELVVSDYIYWWNKTSQAWIYKTNGTSTNNETILPTGAVVYIYNSVDFPWYRENAETNYLHNITNGSNYIPTFKTQTFNKWFNTSLLNSSQGNYTDEGYEFVFNYIAAWNNTGKKWVNGYDKFAWENDTYVGRWANTSLDAVWILSNNYKVTYDTDNNYISQNWTSVGG